MENLLAQRILNERIILGLDVNNPNHLNEVEEKVVKVLSVGEPTDKSSFIVNINAVNAWQAEEIEKALTEGDLEEATNIHLSYNVRRDEFGEATSWLPEKGAYIKAQFKIKTNDEGELRVRCVSIMPLQAMKTNTVLGKTRFGSFFGAAVSKETMVAEETDDVVQEPITTKAKTKVKA